jgi:glutamate dehydrogenase (NADP+)
MDSAKCHPCLVQICAALDIIPFLDRHIEYREHRVLERLTEPDRVVIFRVGWEDDAGNIRANRGYRVQHSNAIGPYKGGIRFDKDLLLLLAIDGQKDCK